MFRIENYGGSMKHQFYKKLYGPLLIGLGLAFVASFQNCAKKNSDSSSNAGNNSSTLSSKAIPKISIYHGSSTVYHNHLYTRYMSEISNNSDYSGGSTYVAFDLYVPEEKVEGMLPVHRCLVYKDGNPHHHFLSNDPECENATAPSGYLSDSEGILGYLYSSPSFLPKGSEIKKIVRCFYSKDGIAFHMASINPSNECSDGGFKNTDGSQKDGSLLGYYSVE